nr:DUF4352 domain-containing protein [Actinomycetales bacterium]
IAVVGAALGGGDDDATPAPPSPTVAAGAPTDAGSPDVSQEAGEPAPAEEAPAQEAPAEEAPAGETLAGIGETVEVGDFAITVTGVEAGIQRVGSEMFGEDPQGQFVTVALTVTNNGNSAEYFFDSGQKLVDEQGREHSSSSAVMYLEDNNLLITQINPGNSASGMLLYDIPVDATPVQIQLSSGLFGRGVVVALG